MPMVVAEKARKTETEVISSVARRILTTKVTTSHANQGDPTEDLEKVVCTRHEVEAVAFRVRPWLTGRCSDVTEVDVSYKVGDLCERPESCPCCEPSR